MPAEYGLKVPTTALVDGNREAFCVAHVNSIDDLRPLVTLMSKYPYTSPAPQVGAPAPQSTNAARAPDFSDALTTDRGQFTS